MRQLLSPNEQVLADKGYNGNRVVHGSANGELSSASARKLRSYHERINGRLKMFGVLGNIFRHKLDKHSMCLFAVANIVQLDLELNEKH